MRVCSSRASGAVHVEARPGGGGQVRRKGDRTASCAASNTVTQIFSSADLSALEDATVSHPHQVHGDWCGEVRSRVVVLSGDSRVCFPKGRGESLGVPSPCVVMQLRQTTSAPVVEFTGTADGCRRKFVLTGHSSARPLAAESPDSGTARLSLPPDRWAVVVVHLPQLHRQVFGSDVGSFVLDGLSVASPCKLRRVFAASTPLLGDVLAASDGALPRWVDLPSHTGSVVVTLPDLCIGPSTGLNAAGSAVRAQSRPPQHQRARRGMVKGHVTVDTQPQQAADDTLVVQSKSLTRAEAQPAELQGGAAAPRKKLTRRRRPQIQGAAQWRNLELSDVGVPPVVATPSSAGSMPSSCDGAAQPQQRQRDSPAQPQQRQRDSPARPVVQPSAHRARRSLLSNRSPPSPASAPRAASDVDESPQAAAELPLPQVGRQDHLRHEQPSQDRHDHRHEHRHEHRHDRHEQQLRHEQPRQDHLRHEQQLRHEQPRQDHHDHRHEHREQPGRDQPRHDGQDNPHPHEDHRRDHRRRDHPRHDHRLFEWQHHPADMNLRRPQLRRGGSGAAAGARRARRVSPPPPPAPEEGSAPSSPTWLGTTVGRWDATLCRSRDGLADFMTRDPYTVRDRGPDEWHLIALRPMKGYVKSDDGSSGDRSDNAD